MLAKVLERILEDARFKSYKLKYGITGTETHWADAVEFTPYSLEDWITRQHIKNTLRTNGYRVEEFPNPFRLEAYKDEQEYTIDCPSTTAKPTPWGMRKDEAVVWLSSSKKNTELISLLSQFGRVE